MGIEKHGIRGRSTEIIRIPGFYFLKPEPIDALWKRAKERGMTYPKIAPLIAERFVRDCHPNTVQGLIKRNEGGAALENQVRVILEEFLASTESVVEGRPKSVVPDLAKFQDRPDDLTPEQLKRKAIQLEERLNQILAICQAPLSSAPSATAYRLAQKALRRSKSEAKPGDAGSSSKAP